MLTKNRFKKKTNYKAAVAFKQIARKFRNLTINREDRAVLVRSARFRYEKIVLENKISSLGWQLV